LEFKKSKIGELNNLSATFNIFYDLVQLALLLFLTGGLTNPFSILIIVPTTIATTFLSRNSSFFIAAVSIILCSVLALFNFPLPGPDGETLKTPKYYLLGMWLSTTIGIIFLGN
jgi:two-component system sensor histidine kinase RegB